MDQVSQEELLVIPAWSAIIEVLHDSGIARKVLEVHPNLAEREFAGAVCVESPPVGIADPVETTQVSFYEVRVLRDEPEERAQFPGVSSPNSSDISFENSSR